MGLAGQKWITKNFCHLTSRLGFHFSTVEALAGEEPLENYLHLTLKGGAANAAGKGLRGRLIGELLERHHFKVDINNEALFAHLEGEAKDYLLSRLRILGYLTIHTRQLDVIMHDEARKQAHFEKLRRDVDGLVLA